MELNSKQKSNIIFWSLFLGLLGFLYLTPWGSSTRIWLSGLTLSSPDIEQSRINNANESFVETDWNLQSTLGDEVWLSDYEKPIFINIWATWCPPCKAELPSIIALYEKYKYDVTFLLISPDENIEKLQNFATKHDYKVPFYNELSYTPNNLRTDSYPTTFILNKNKEITHKMIGSHNWDDKSVHDILDELISGDI